MNKANKTGVLNRSVAASGDIDRGSPILPFNSAVAPATTDVPPPSTTAVSRGACNVCSSPSTISREASAN
ncbi:hypothetical protein KK103_17465 [Curtobacterium flaccumfaciens pv. flaccumfaciens]|uniref:Uncharacterized protein n=1 Tax=Curtobacterium flaccumfaciens pv. flaccumfaciens TaxID=138532 RepID=A0A9Q2W934_9MICO|nr:hypothetical protein [Curtobacterium flaccumfaciens]MBT1543554.1 hypothetical protein [Curtobacterium flaccumfaciens pv. flaccumfaciens]